VSELSSNHEEGEMNIISEVQRVVEKGVRDIKGVGFGYSEEDIANMDS
jgi:hypothetical protein